MSPNCIEVERIGDIEGLPEEHSTRRHVTECPRCQCLWLSYQSFLKADIGDSAHVDGSRAALEKTIRARSGAQAEPRAARMANRPAWSFGWRPALVTAMAVVLVVVAFSVWRGGPSDEPVLRGGDNEVPMPTRQASGRSGALDDEVPGS